MTSIFNRSGSATLGGIVLMTDLANDGLAHERLWIQANPKTLTETVATAFVQVGVPSGSVTAGNISYTVRSDDATDFQVGKGTLSYRIINKAGTETCVVAEVEAFTTTTSLGTLTNNGFDTDVTPVNACNLRANITSSLTQTTLNITYKVFKDGGTGAITPQ